jgi:CMP-N-acetylneuraminic acid synthetase|tara:strand:+ start:119 stop:271 length:153 start_codon:yes stop_codon:yes gene_type:complete
MNKKFKNLAIIPARGGSKRIKNKNINKYKIKSFNEALTICSTDLMPLQLF